MARRRLSKRTERIAEAVIGTDIKGGTKNFVKGRLSRGKMTKARDVRI